ncbi:MAG: 4-(cytidine 5'-diphospho)-2-C-methyl-D-erythritol kinase [Gaiellaceae bacterium]
MPAEVTRAPATAKINLALVVGAQRPDGLHEVMTVLQRVDLVDRVSIAPAPEVRVTGFAGDTLVRRALQALAGRTGARGWHAHLAKRIPIASGLGGGSSDAATALRLANALLPQPLAPEALAELAAALGADVPFFLTSGPQLGEGTGASLRPLDLPTDYWIVLVLPRDVAKPSTGAVYDAFDRREGADGAEARRAALRDGLASITEAADLAGLPPNDLASSPLADELRELGAFRADVTGAGPTVYGLFLDRAQAVAARRSVRRFGRTWITVPAWYG